MANCKVCQEEIHPLRVKMGYKTTCVKHSTAERYTGFVVTDGKTADKIKPSFRGFFYKFTLS